MRGNTKWVVRENGASYIDIRIWYKGLSPWKFRVLKLNIDRKDKFDGKPKPFVRDSWAIAFILATNFAQKCISFLFYTHTHISFVQIQILHKHWKHTYMLIFHTHYIKQKHTHTHTYKHKFLLMR